MAEFDPIPQKNAAETAYRDALLADESGRDGRRVRLMSALPRPEPAPAVAVAATELAWRWRPYGWGLLVTGLLIAAVLVMRGRAPESPPPGDPRLAAAESASTPVVAAQAPVVADVPPAAHAPHGAAKARPERPRVDAHPPVVVADATVPKAVRESEAAAVEPARSAVTSPPMPSEAEVLAGAGSVASGGALARATMAPRIASSLAASGAAELVTANAVLLAAVRHADAVTARSALSAGAPVHLRDAEGRTLLMLAARSGAREVVDLLLAAGARKADRDPQGWTAADHAQALGHGELALLLR